MKAPVARVIVRARGQYIGMRDGQPVTDAASLTDVRTGFTLLFRWSERLRGYYNGESKLPDMVQSLARSGVRVYCFGCDREVSA